MFSVSDKKLNFTVDYSKHKIFSEYNTKSFDYPIILSSPHSGKDFPQEFLENSRLSKEELRSSEDCYVDELIMQASNAGLPMMEMEKPRTLSVANRDTIEIEHAKNFDRKKRENKNR